MMKLYHFTAEGMLRGIAQHGLTVGDVPTDLQKMRGVVGVWLTADAAAAGHGLTGSALNKQRMRLTVEIEDTDPKLVKWTEWAKRRVTALTIEALQRAGGERFESWYVYFGWIKSDSISSVVDMTTGNEIEDWKTAVPEHLSEKGVPYWRRDQWHKKTLNAVRRELTRRRLG